MDAVTVDGWVADLPPVAVVERRLWKAAVHAVAAELSPSQFREFQTRFGSAVHALAVPRMREAYAYIRSVLKEGKS